MKPLTVNKTFSNACEAFNLKLSKQACEHQTKLHTNSMDASNDDDYTLDDQAALRENGNGCCVGGWQLVKQKAAPSKHNYNHFRMLSLVENSNRRAVSFHIFERACVTRGQSNKFSEMPSFHLRSALNSFGVSLDFKSLFNSQTALHASKLPRTFCIFSSSHCAD